MKYEKAGVVIYTSRRLYVFAVFAVKLLIKMLNAITKGKEMTEDWKKSTLIPMYKKKIDERNCSNYKEVKLKCHTMKIYKMLWKDD